MSTQLRIGDRWHRWIYLQRVELWLSPLPGKQRRAVLKELKASMADAAAETGMDTAIDDLGRPRTLARAYVDGEPQARPSWYLGGIIAASLFGLFLYLGVAYSIGMMDALLDSGTPAASGSFFGLGIDAFYTPTSVGFQTNGFSWPILIIIVLGFLIGSRIWRLLPSAREVTSARD